MASESILQQQLARYITARYPDVQFHSDFGSGVKLTRAQAAIQQRQNAYRRGWPDLFIARPVASLHGLFLELKRDGTRLKKKNGEWATPHIAEQAEILEQLRIEGYEAQFAVGFNEAKKDNR